MTTQQNNAIQAMINYTNERIVGWYEKAKEYGIKGAGIAYYNSKENKVVVEFTENGKQSTWSMAYYAEYVSEESINWVYNCWSELA